jgi:protein-S-isoprenylcysteine O-methyltransferase Ste14
MEIKNNIIESFLKSFTFSFLLSLYPAYWAFVHTCALAKDFNLFDLLWLIYNLLIVILFLIRIRPSIVSMNPLHWIVALVASFSGFFFFKEENVYLYVPSFITNTLMCFAFFVHIPSAFILGKSFDFLPALRRIKTKYLYQFVRHPMYLAALIGKLSYVLNNQSIYNLLLLVIFIFIYDKRAKYEESILLYDNSYSNYMQKTKYRFVPGIY